jgi:hypothetical protein
VGRNDFCDTDGAGVSEPCAAANLVKLTVFLTDVTNLGRYRKARNWFFASALCALRAWPRRA